MILRKLLFCFILISLNVIEIAAQSPPYFSYNTENSAPSNEMYWVHQDKDGYIWIGCDAGLYRFNGVRYEHFTSTNLTAHSATGIIQSKTTGRIYGYNFNRQIFFVENEQLTVVKGWDGPVNGLADDTNGLKSLSENLQEKRNDVICIPTQNGFEYQPVNEVDYLEADNSFVNIYCTNNPRKTVSKNLKYLENTLPSATNSSFLTSPT